MKSATEIEHWLKTRVSELLELSLDRIDSSKPLTKYGLDSSAAIGLTHELALWLEVELDPTVVYDYPSIAQLAKHLSP